MKRISFFVAAVVAMVLLGVVSAQAQIGTAAGGGGVVFDAEALFFKYHRADGVRAGSFSNIPPTATDDIAFDRAATPRLTLGLVSGDGLGVRMRYWEYAQVGGAVFPSTGVSMNVDTYTFDVELFEDIRFNDRWSLEISGGIRYNEFDEVMIDTNPAVTRLNSFTGFGGIIGLEATRSLGRWGALYARGRGAIMADDKTVREISATPHSAILTDSTQGMTEIAIGYEYSRLVGNCRLAFRVGYEWQNWFNYSSNYSPFTTNPGNLPPSFTGAGDVGFNGVGLQLAVYPGAGCRPCCGGCVD